MTRAQILTLTRFMYDRHPIHATLLDGQPWFVALDVCRLLRLRLMPAMSGLGNSDKIRVPRSYVRGGKSAAGVLGHSWHTSTSDAVWFISECGLHELIPRTVLDDDRPIRRWVIGEMLPTLRAHPPGDVPRDSLPTRTRTVLLEATTPVRNGDHPHALYRFFGANRQLLYIGITLRLETRLAEHRRTSPWWAEVNHATFEHFANRDDAAAAETAAIAAEHPIHNVAKVVV